jgi:hypothetical protein
MKTGLKITSLMILILSTILTAANSTQVELGEVYEMPLAGSLPADARSLLPAAYEVPANLPAKISDPLLLAAWVYLYNQEDSISIHNGESLSGHDLAEYALKRQVPVAWGSDEICRGNSCSVRPICKDAKCVRKYKADKVNTIYLSQRYYEATPEALVKMAGSLAHELYHHQLPFGPVYTSLYEEYWAYKIGGTISQASWADFEGYDPLQATCLKQWFSDHNWQGFSDSDLYPFTLTVKADLTTPTCVR